MPNLLVSYGLKAIRLTSADISLIRELACIYTESQDSPGETIELNLDDPSIFAKYFPGSPVASNPPPLPLSPDTVVPLVARVGLSSHKECLWLEGALLVSAQGKKLLLAGPSHAGKTTLTLCLAGARSWTIISEDILLLSPNAGTAVPITAPLSLRADSPSKLSKVGVQCPEGKRLVVAHEYFHKTYLAPPFDCAIVLEPLTNQSPPDLVANPISPSEAVHRLLTISNALRLPDGVDELGRWLADAKCFVFDGGSLQQRMDFVSAMESESQATRQGNS